MKKDLNYYLSFNYDIKIRQLTEEEGSGWFAEIPLLPGCMGDGDSAEELLINIQDARKCWIETSLQIGKTIPEPALKANS